MAVVDGTALASFGMHDDPENAAPADVCLLVEGTYPFVSGGVSSWVHDIILRPPRADVRGAERRLVSRARTASRAISCRERRRACTACSARSRRSPPLDGAGAGSAARADPRAARRDGRALGAVARAGRARSACTSRARPAPSVLAALASNDLTLPELLHGRASFELLTTIAERVAPDAPFLDLFWHFRAIHVPVLRLLAAPTVRGALLPRRRHRLRGPAGRAVEPPHRPPADGDRARHLRARARHGAGARRLDPRRRRAACSEPRSTWAPRVSPLRRLWSSFFRALSRLAYVQARNIVTLSRRRTACKQIADGAPPDKIEIVPNGVALHSDARGRRATNRPPAIDDGVIALPAAPPARRLRGPRRADQGPGHLHPRLRPRARQRRSGRARHRPDGRGSRLRRALPRSWSHGSGASSSIQFVGPMPPARIYGDLDVVVLTSFSEGQPLVILEAYAWGVP